MKAQEEAPTGQGHDKAAAPVVRRQEQALSGDEQAVGRPAWYPAPSEGLRRDDAPGALSSFSLRSLTSDEISFTPHLDGFPLVLEARQQSDRGALLQLLARHRPAVLAALAEYGALLFRGFDLATAEDFEEAPRALGLSPAEHYDFGTTRRRRIAGNVFSSTDYNRVMVIPPHSEMSYSNCRPSWVAFHCAKPPRRWGETPIFDMAGVFRDLPDALKARYRDNLAEIYRHIPLRQRFLRTRRTVAETFGTEDREEIAAFTDQLGVELTWMESGQLRASCRVPAVLPHPTTGALCWVSLLVNPHAYSLTYRYFAHRHRPIRRVITRFLKDRIGKVAARHNNDTLLEGRPLSDEETAAVYDSLFRNCSIFTWRQGDFLLLDGIRTGHARVFYDGRRDVRACFGDVYDVRLMTAV